MMDQQLDQIVIRKFLQPRRDWLLPKIELAITDDCSKHERWMEIFTTIFILVHSCAVQLKQEHSFAKRYGMSGRYGPYGKYKDAEDQFHTARSLLAFFHFNYRGAFIFTHPSIPHVIARDAAQSEIVIWLREQIAERSE
jgi:hypothetical protein